jgi:hypothetical protein
MSARRRHIGCRCGHFPPRSQPHSARRMLGLPGHFFARSSPAQASNLNAGRWRGRCVRNVTQALADYWATSPRRSCQASDRTGAFPVGRSRSHVIDVNRRSSWAKAVAAGSAAARRTRTRPEAVKHDGPSSGRLDRRHRRVARRGCASSPARLRAHPHSFDITPGSRFSISSSSAKTNNPVAQVCA